VGNATELYRLRKKTVNIQCCLRDDRFNRFNTLHCTNVCWTNGLLLSSVMVIACAVLIGDKSVTTSHTHTHTHTHAVNSPLSGTTRVSRYQKSKTNVDFTEATDREWQWHQLGHMQVCTSLQTDNHVSTPPLSFYRPDALPAAQPNSVKALRAPATTCYM